MIRTVFAAVVAASLGSGCVLSAFSTPVQISTRSGAAGATESLGTISVKQCAVVVAIIPVFDPWDPVDVYDELLTKADAIDADALVDYQMKGGDFAGFYPFFVRGCFRHEATAVRLR